MKSCDTLLVCNRRIKQAQFSSDSSKSQLYNWILPYAALSRLESFQSFASLLAYLTHGRPGRAAFPGDLKVGTNAVMFCRAKIKTAHYLTFTSSSPRTMSTVLREMILLFDQKWNCFWYNLSHKASRPE